MPRIHPFRGIHYNKAVIGDLSDVVTPPYDNIPDSEKGWYLNRSPYNFTHVILPREGDENYVRATELLGKWKQNKVLIEDPGPYYYLYRQSFAADGRTWHRHSLMATVPLSDFSEGHVRPHENTHGTHREDRLRILRATRHNLSHVFAMVRDPEATLATLYEEWCFEAPLLRAKTRDGVEQAVWRVSPDKARDLPAFFESRPLYILDGHHRYSSALAYARELGVLGTNHPAARILFSIANSADPALKVFPTHRRLKHPPEKFPWEAFERSFRYRKMDEGELARMCATPLESPGFALFVERELYFVEPVDWVNAAATYGDAMARQSVLWSDEKLLTGILGLPADERVHAIDYERDWQTFWKERDTSRLLVFHAPPSVESVARVADEKGFMPQKSTFFFPKLAAGLMMRSHETDR